MDGGFEGSVRPDCTSLTGTISAAFDARDFSIPGRKDVDTDGDGAFDGCNVDVDVVAELQTP